MKKLFACGAALSLMLIACGDDSSSTGPEPITGGESSSSEMVLSSGETADSSSGGDAESSSATAPVSSGTEPESSSAIAPESSAAEPASSAAEPESSSAADPASSATGPASSSSVTPVDPSRQIIKKAEAACTARSGENPLLDGASNTSTMPGAIDVVVDTSGVDDTALPPVAHIYVGTDSAEVVIENVSMTCAAVIEQIEVSLTDEGNETLYVNPVIDMSLPQADCICPTRLTFNIAAIPEFVNASLLELPSGERMKVIKADRV